MRQLMRDVQAPVADTPHWQLGRLLAAPHRLAFGAAAAMLGLSALWWCLALVAQSQGRPLAWTVAPVVAHGLLMSFGFMPLFFAGFLFTAGPKWLEQPAVDARRLLAPVLAQLGGWGVFLLGVHGPEPAFGAALCGFGLAAVALGWGQVLWRFIYLLMRSRAEDQLHARLIAAGGLLGALALWAAVFGLATARASLVQAATQISLWGFAGTVFATVSHRMIPFFSSAALPALDAWRPRWLLWCWTGLFALEAAVLLAELQWGPLSPALRWLQTLLEGGAGIGLLALALRWGQVQDMKLRLLAMLHLGFVWLGTALLLSAVSHGLMALSEGRLSLGLAPLHAYTMGFLGSTLLAMVTRVSCGHGGRTTTADDFIWRLFWLLQLAVLLRVLGGVLQATGLGLIPVPPLLAWTALIWAAVCIAWALRYGHWYGLPRSDGRPG
ncbi:MAG: NnrS family protein [Burkholderiaceae bacterium]|nr:NnrS family protein [Burkholderiaceae bacterium]